MNAADKLKTTAVPFTTVATRLGWRDHLGAWGVRWGIKRMDFRVAPGLYATGTPNLDSPVLVTGNYKMSFDLVRQALDGIDAWIVVLDTKGVNVWCAAGKGTFGTQELVQRLASVRLKEVVAHRNIIVPQLGAVGVAAPVVAAFSGFKVSFGPVRAADLPAYLAAGRVKTAEMARVKFTFVDRLVLVPIELTQAWWLLPLFAVIGLLMALPADGQFLTRFLAVLPAMLATVALGAIAFPLLLPVLPFRAFALKGLVVGGIGLAAVFGWAWCGPLAASQATLSHALLLGSAGLMSLPVIIYLAMNFTGCTTFTCQTGANLEVERSIIPLIAAAGLGILLGLARVILALSGVL